jgi:hypothetical protein
MSNMPGYVRFAPFATKLPHRGESAALCQSRPRAAAKTLAFVPND